MADGLPKRLVADYGYWSRTQNPPYSSAQIPFRKMTHLNHAGVSFNSDGSSLGPRWISRT
jgi:GH18 family chitinase